MSHLEETKGYIMNSIPPIPVPHPPSCPTQRHRTLAVSCIDSRNSSRLYKENYFISSLRSSALPTFLLPNSSFFFYTK